jgi:hypothetical protein
MGRVRSRRLIDELVEADAKESLWTRDVGVPRG